MFAIFHEWNSRMAMENDPFISLQGSVGIYKAFDSMFP